MSWVARNLNNPAFLTQLYRVGLCVTVLWLTGCSSAGYYWQAIQGHLDIKSREQPIDELLADMELDGGLRVKLQLARQARQFASERLALPDNDSYTRYADLDRSFVVWNVVATPPLSIEPRQWCYLFVGCLSYRGFFAKADAHSALEVLREAGMDVALAGASAYSSLGYFDDPLLNTMLRRDETELVGVIFHELAHQMIYVAGDTAFNEGFASAVEQEGLRRWYAAKQDAASFERYQAQQAQRQAIYAMLRDARNRLAELYRGELDEATKLVLKSGLFDKLRQDYQYWRSKNDYDKFDNWFAQELNNAHLALIATYQDHVPAFRALIAAVDGDLRLFYKSVERLAQLDSEQRNQILTLEAREE